MKGSLGSSLRPSCGVRIMAACGGLFAVTVPLERWHGRTALGAAPNTTRGSTAEQRRHLEVAPRNRRLSQKLCAKRVDRGNAGVKDDEGLDEDLRTGLNEMANEAIRVMLGEDIQELMRFRDKVDTVGEYLVEEGLMDAARFTLVLRGMLEHHVLPEAELLNGAYKKAYEKIGGVMEDSGWLLAPPEAEVGNVEMVDDELIPPVLQRPY